MAGRRRYALEKGPLPEALPPENRPVGQLIAEALRLYGRRFWAAIPTGLSLALVDQLFKDQPIWLWLVGAPALLAAGFVGACAVALPRAPGVRPLASAFAAGVLVLLPFPFLFSLFIVPALVWLALAGLAVPVALVEAAGLRASFVRAFRLARADVMHAVGAITALALTYAFTRYALVLLLQGSGEQPERAAVLLADLVLGPVLFLGAALLYVDQAARFEEAAARQSRPGSSGRHRRRSLRIGSPSRRRRDADVRDAVDADPSGRADAEVQP